MTYIPRLGVDVLNLDLSAECYMIEQERTVLQTVAILV